MLICMIRRTFGYVDLRLHVTCHGNAKRAPLHLLVSLAVFDENLWEMGEKLIMKRAWYVAGHAI